MAEQSPTKQLNDRTVTPVRLKTGREALMGAVLQRAQQGDTLPKRLEGRVAIRAALPLDALVRLQRQLDQVVMGLQRKPTAQS